MPFPSRAIAWSVAARCDVNIVSVESALIGAGEIDARMRPKPEGGHQVSLNIAAGLGLNGNESYPDLFQPYGGFPDGVRVESGFITIPDLPGNGFEGKSDLIKVMRDLP